MVHLVSGTEELEVDIRGSAVIVDGFKSKCTHNRYSPWGVRDGDERSPKRLAFDIIG